MFFVEFLQVDEEEGWRRRGAAGLGPWHDFPGQGARGGLVLWCCEENGTHRSDLSGSPRAVQRVGKGP